MSDETDLYWSCVRKKAYTDEKLARRVASRAFAMRGDRLTVYPCVNGCGQWHLTKFENHRKFKERR